MRNKIVIIEKFDHYGRGISRIGDMPVFIDGALPGEEVEIEITKYKKKYMEGKIIKINKQSQNRVIPSCPYYDKCGGCNLMHMDYNTQLKFKESKVKEIMQKFAGIDEVNEAIGTDSLFYRNKVTLRVDKKIGFYKNKSYDIIYVEKCIIADKKINEIISRLSQFSICNVEKIVIRTNLTEIMLIFYTNVNINDEIINGFKDIHSVIQIDNTTKKVIHGKDNLINQIDNYKFFLSPTSFFQVNFDVMKKIYNKASTYADVTRKSKLLDLYCGTGTIGIYIGKGNETLGIEISEEAIKNANINKDLNNNQNIVFKVGDVKEIIDEINFDPDIIIVDPPRSGLDINTIKTLKKIKSPKIVYISCDPITLARDINNLKEYYDVIEITPFDMFPNTYHVECVSLLILK